MVDIGPDGIKFEKDDVCANIHDNFLKNNKMLDALLDKGKNTILGNAKEKLGELTGLGNAALSDPQAAIDGAKSDADTAAGAATSLKDKVLGGELIEGSDASIKTLSDCLGGGLPDFGFPDVDSPIDLSELGKMMDQLASAVLNKLADLIKEALSPLENAIADALNAMKDLLPLDLLDQILNIIQCIEGCPNIDQSKLPTLIDIEDKVSSIGLKITGEIDWESGAFSGLGDITDEMKGQFDTISSAKEDLKGTIGGVSDVKLPDIPDLPTIPRPVNPLDGLSLKEKIESLF